MKKLLHWMIIPSVLVVMFALPGFAAYPDKPVKFIVPFPPGDAEDILTRIIAKEMQSMTGASAAVINKPGGGAGPFPGALDVLAAPADGYTIGSFVIGVPVIGPLVGIEGIERDTFEPVGIFLTYPFVLVAGANAPYSNMKELAIEAKKKDLALGHFGYGLVPTRVTIVAAQELGFEFGSEAAFDALDCNTLASGDVDLMNTTLPQILPCLDKVKVLASITEERISLLPKVKTMNEQVSGTNVALWNGLFVKKGTPQAVKNKIAEIAQKALKSDKAVKFANETGTQIYWKNASQSTKQIDADFKTIQEIFKKMK